MPGMWGERASKCLVTGLWLMGLGCAQPGRATWSRHPVSPPARREKDWTQMCWKTGGTRQVWRLLDTLEHLDDTIYVGDFPANPECSLYAATSNFRGRLWLLIVPLICTFSKIFWHDNSREQGSNQGSSRQAAFTPELWCLKPGLCFS